MSEPSIVAEGRESAVVVVHDWEGNVIGGGTLPILDDLGPVLAGRTITIALTASI